MSIRETCGKQNDKNRICKNAHIQIAEYVHFIYLAQLNAWTSVIFYYITTLIISKKPGNTGISRDIRTEFTTDLLLSD